MSHIKKSNLLAAAWMVILLGLVIRVILSSLFLLAPDETNYWQWSRYLDLGYQDHPPMIAWTIWLSTLLFGQNELAVRLPANIGVTIAIMYMALLSARMFSRHTAFHVALLCQGILLFNGAAMIATPDGMLLPCWAGATYHAALALKENRSGHWLATGFWFGLGLISKYTMLLFLPSLLLCILIIPAYRQRLFQAMPWLGLVFGFSLFTPVLIWNSRNEWATFRHVLYMSGVDKTDFFTFKYVGEFLAGQFGVLTPLIFCLILVGWLKTAFKSSRTDDDLRFLAWMSLPTFLIFLALSLHSRVYGNWPAAGYLTGIVLVAALFSASHATFRKQNTTLWKMGVATAYLITVPIFSQAVYPVLPVPVKYDRTARETKGWDVLGDNVAEVLGKMKKAKDPFIFGIHYQHASELAFYTPGQPRTVSLNRWHRPNVYDYWFDDSMLIGRDAVGVVDKKEFINMIRPVFAKVKLERELPVYRSSPWRGKELITTFYIVRAYGFKGGQRWKPKEEGDIRATRKQTAS